MIEGVEGIHFEQELNTLGNTELLTYRCVPVIESRSPESVAGNVSKGAQRRLGEAGWIDPRELPGNIGVNITAGHDIRMHELAVVNSLNIVRCDGKREAALEGSNTAEFPSANCQVCCAIDLVRIPFATAKRQLPYIAGDKALVN